MEAIGVFLRGSLGLILIATFSMRVSANDWPQACYNETSMWVTNACKEYIETVYYAAPGPAFGAGIGGLALLIALGYLLGRRLRSKGG